MITPPYLQPGDKIGIVAPSRKVTRDTIAKGISLLRNEGFEIVESKNLFGDANQFSGTDIERAHDMQQMIDDNSIKAIVVARGGYGCTRIADEVDLALLMDKPKWIVGFSDVTALHTHINANVGVETIHANVLTCYNDAFDEKSFTTMVMALTGDDIVYTWHTSSEHVGCNKPGEITAELIGGNLSLIHNTCGTNSEIDVTGKILFIEDVDEYLYHIDRMMVQLKRSGKLEVLAGLVVGGFTKMHDNDVAFGKNATEIIYSHAHEYGYPIVFDFPAGHTSLNCALIMGREVTLNVGDTNTLLFHKGEV